MNEEDAKIEETHELIQKELDEIIHPHYPSQEQNTEENFSVTTPKVSALKKNKPVTVEKKKIEVPRGNRVIVIGAGIAGLATAALLGKKGYHVTVLEKNSQVGGAVATSTESGFTFEKSLTIYTMPEIFEHFFSLMGEDIKQYFTVKRLSPSYRLFTETDSKKYDILSDVEENAALFETLEPGAGEKLRTYVTGCKKHYSYLTDEFFFKNFSSLFDLINFSKLQILGKTKNLIAGLFKHETIRAILQLPSLFMAGTNPADLPTAYKFLNYIDFNSGTWYVEGGITKVVEAIKKITDKHGVTYFNDAPVKKILANGAVRGVELQSGRTIESDIVISNADMHHVETELLSKELQTYPESYWSGKTIGPSAFVLHLGLKEKLEQFVDRNIIIPKSFDAGMSEIFGKKKFPDNPIVYIQSSVLENKQSLSIFVPIPAGTTYAETDLALYMEKVVHIIEIALGITDLKNKIEYYKTCCDKDFEKDYNSYKGTIFGLSQRLGQIGPLRPRNESKKVKNLFYVGADTNPGIGLSMCLISAELVYKKIEGIDTTLPLEKI